MISSVINQLSLVAALSGAVVTAEPSADAIDIEPTTSSGPSDAEATPPGDGTAEPSVEPRDGLEAPPDDEDADGDAARSTEVGMPSEVAGTIYEAFMRQEIEVRTRQRSEFCQPAHDARRSAYFLNNSVAGANVLGSPPTSTLAERFAAAVNTGVDGVEAGIIVSPLAFLKSADTYRPPGLTLMLAGLKEGKTRFGVGMGGQVTQSVVAGDVLRRGSCGKNWTKSITQEVGKVLTEARESYEEVCAEIVPKVPDRGEANAARRERLRRYCAPSQAEDILLAGLHGDLSNEARETDGQLNGEALARAMGIHAKAMEGLGKAKDDLARSSSGMPADKEEFVKAYRLAAWSRWQVRLAVDYSMDFQPRKFGVPRVEPTETGMPGRPEELPDGAFDAARIGPSMLVRRRRWEVNTSLMVEYANILGTKKEGWNLNPSVGLTYLVAFLDRRKVEGKYLEARPEIGADGSLPPRFILGTKATLGIPLRPPPFQRENLNAVDLLFHADFAVTDKLKFRIGVPIKAELVEQKANTDAEPDIPQRTLLRWTIPVFGTTVLAF